MTGPWLTRRDLRLSREQRAVLAAERARRSSWSGGTATVHDSPSFFSRPLAFWCCPLAPDEVDAALVRREADALQEARGKRPIRMPGAHPNVFIDLLAKATVR